MADLAVLSEAEASITGKGLLYPVEGGSLRSKWNSCTSGRVKIAPKCRRVCFRLSLCTEACD